MAGIKIEDFDVDKIVLSDQHAKDIEGLSTRISKIENKIDTPLHLADSIVECSVEAVKMQEMLECAFLKLISKNEPVRKEIGQLIKQVDRGYVQAQLKKYGTWIAAGMLFLLCQLSSELIKWAVERLGAAKSTFTSP